MNRFMQALGLSGNSGRGRAELGRMAGASLQETAALYPFALLAAVYVLGTSPLGLLLLAGGFHYAGTLAGDRQSRAGGSRLLLPALTAAAIVAGILACDLRPAGAAGAAALLAAAVRGLITGRKRLWTGVQIPLPLWGIALSVILYVYIAGSNPPALTPHRTELYVLCMTNLFVLLLRWNTDQVRSASPSYEVDGQTASRIAAVNRRLTWLTLIPIVLIGAWQGFGPLLLRLARWLISLLQSSSIPAEPPKQEESLAAAELRHMAKEEIGGTPLWLTVLGYTLLGLLSAAIAAGLAVLLYKLLSKWLPERLRLWVRGLLQGFRRLRAIRRAPGEQAEYLDEVERIEGVPPKRWWRRRPDGKRQYAGGDPRQAYRQLIARAMKRGFVFHTSRTPSENGTELETGSRYTDYSPEEVRQLIARYNEDRYGRR